MAKRWTPALSVRDIDNRHPGLDPGSTFFLKAHERAGGCRIKSGMTDEGKTLARNHFPTGVAVRHNAGMNLRFARSSSFRTQRARRACSPFSREADSRMAGVGFVGLVNFRRPPLRLRRVWAIGRAG